jgi:hypothetical protein
MLLVGAIDAARKCADVLGDMAQSEWLASFREGLVESLNRLWDPEKCAYPDSLHADGSVSDSISQHTSFLALLYDIATPEIAPHTLENVLIPPEGMVRVGSPFASMYYYEALEKVEQPDVILKSIYDAYLPMLASGATTVWETFPSSNITPGIFPTRSHCHAWSSAPLYFLPRILLGIRPTSPGGASFEVSPRLNSLTYASGTIATARGALHAEWRVDGDTLHVKINAPEGVDVQFVENDTHAGLKVEIAVFA